MYPLGRVFLVGAVLGLSALDGQNAEGQTTENDDVSGLPSCDAVKLSRFNPFPDCINENGERAQVLCIGCFQLPSVYVNATRTPEAPGSLSLIGQNGIASLAADHPAEVLNTLPGVNIHMNSGQEHLVALRSPVLTGGAGQGSFLVLQNGVPTRSPAFGNVNMLFEPHHEIAGVVEVIRGPASAEYGSNAVHGLMNFVFLTPQDQVDVRASVSTLNRYKTDLSFANDTSFAALSLQQEAGWRDDTGLSQQKLSLMHDFELGDWNGEAWLSYANLNQETAGFIQGNKAYRDEDIANSNPNPEAFRDAQFAMAAVRLENDYVTVTPYVRWQDMRFRQHFLPYRGFEENSHAALGIMGDYTIEFEDSTWRIGGMFDVASGDLLETQPEPFGFFPGDSRFPEGVHYDYTVDTQAAAIWTEVEHEIVDDVTVLAGLRLETHAYDYSTRADVGINGRFNVPEDRTDRFNLVTPKLGVIWRDAIGDVDLYANYARGQRAPQASDLYRLQSQQVVAEVNTETLDSLEIGGRGNALDDRLIFDVAAYVMEKENFFFRDADGLNVPNGRTNHIGIELASNFAITEDLSISSVVSWAEHTYAFDRAANGIVSGNRVDTAPEWLGDVSVEYVKDDYSLDVMAEFIGEYFTDAGNAVDYNGHTVVSARGGYAVTDNVEIWLKVRNLFDVAYADRADFAFGNDRYFPGEPLNLTFGVRSSW